MNASQAVTKWLSLKDTRKSDAKKKFKQWLIDNGFFTNENLSGTYKNVYIHPDYDFVVKISKRGSGNALPKHKKIQDLLLLPIYCDKYVMIQHKVDTSREQGEHAFEELSRIISKRKMEDYFRVRDFAPINCGFYESRPVIFDLSYFSGFTVRDEDPAH